MYFIELMLTRKCNQSCHYCTTHSKGNTEVDIDYLKYVLSLLPDETGVELTGGEIGLITNIDEVYRTVKKHKKIMHIIALSNGLLRLKEVDWLNEVEYWEHLIYEIDGKTIKRFYDLDLEQDHKYIIVTTEITTKSLIEHWDWYDSIGLFRPNFFYKLMNHKSKNDVVDFYDDLMKLYSRLGNVYFQRMLIHRHMKNYMKNQKILCQKYSPNPFIDFKTRQIGHCAINVNESLKYDFNETNLQNVIQGKLIEAPYCQKCYTFDNGKNRNMLNNRSYIQ